MKRTDECKWRCRPSHIEGEESVWKGKRRGVPFRIVSACTGEVNQKRAGWESYRTTNVGGLARVHPSLAAPTLWRQIIVVLNFSLLWGVQWVSFLMMNLMQTEFFLPDPSLCQITVLVGQDRRCAAVTSISNGKQNVWRCSVRGAVAGQRWRLKLGMRVSHPCCYSGTTILPSSVILVWAEWSAPSKKLRTGCQGQEGV